MKNIIFLLLISLSICLSAQDVPSLTPDIIQGIETLKKNGHIKYYKGSEQIVQVNPDIFKMLSFQDRKTFTMNLCIYVNRYENRDLTPDDWWIRIENMATNKKMAHWDMTRGYREF